MTEIIAPITNDVIIVIIIATTIIAWRIIDYLEKRST